MTNDKIKITFSVEELANVEELVHQKRNKLKELFDVAKKNGLNSYLDPIATDIEMYDSVYEKIQDAYADFNEINELATLMQKMKQM